MKRTQLVLSVLALGLSGLAQANSFPADAEASYNLPASSSYADKHAGSSWSAQSVFPADAEAMITVQARDSYVEKHAGSAASAQNVFPADAEALITVQAPGRSRSEPSVALIAADE